MIAAIIVFWYVLGIAGFVYWWTHDWNLEIRDLGLAAMAGTLGPFAWVAGWCLHAPQKQSRVIIHKRGSL